MAVEDDEDERFWTAGDGRGSMITPDAHKVRPRVKGSGPSDLHVVFSRVPNEMYAKLQKVAELDGKSVSFYVAGLIEKALRNKEARRGRGPVRKG
jgi:hypothetical protein